MKTRECILELIKAQNSVRRVWAELENSSAEKTLRDIDHQITKVINELGKTLCTASK